MSPTSPLRHGNQQATMSAKMRRLFKLYEDELHLRYSERTVPDYLRLVRRFLNWLHERGVALSAVNTATLATYQGDLLVRVKKDGKPYSIPTQLRCLTAVRSFFRFLYRRGYLLHDPSASLELPSDGEKTSSKCAETTRSIANPSCGLLTTHRMG